GGRPLDSVQISRDTELRTAVGAISLNANDADVHVRLRSYSNAERARGLALLAATFAAMQARRDATMGSGPGVVTAAGEPTGIAVDTAVYPMTEVFAQPVTLSGRQVQSPRLFVDYLGAIGDAWDEESGWFRPRYAWFVFGVSRQTAGRWHVVVSLDGPAGGAVVLAGQTVLRVSEIDENGVARMEVTGGLPIVATALR
ncbi:MAG: hypothetical protein ACREH4_16025, partial [Vitreimonas sp.]